MISALCTLFMAAAYLDPSRDQPLILYGGCELFNDQGDSSSDTFKSKIIGDRRFYRPKQCLLDGKGMGSGGAS